MKSHTWAVSALLAANLVAAGLSIPTASADNPSPTVNSCSSGPETMPSEIAILCDNTLRVDKITWSSWNAIRASGRGTQFLVVCEPSCATGTPIYTPAAITLEGAKAPDCEVHSYPLRG